MNLRSLSTKAFFATLLILVPVSLWYGHRFSFNYYNDLLAELGKSRYVVFTVQRFLKEGPCADRVNVILRHDVDFAPLSALRFAELERVHAINSTYYLRVQFVNLCQPLSGFEIGLHYENAYLDKYNWTLAIKHFSEDLALMRSIVPVYTVCSHGNSPTQKYWNGAMWNFTTLQAFGLNYDATLNFSGKTYRFYSDSSREWHEWIQILEGAKEGDVIYFLIHPDWWHWSII